MPRPRDQQYRARAVSVHAGNAQNKTVAAVGDSRGSTVAASDRNVKRRPPKRGVRIDGAEQYCPPDVRSASIKTQAWPPARG